VPNKRLPRTQGKASQGTTGNKLSHIYQVVK
jgi:hypothetical protein